MKRIAVVLMFGCLVFGKRVDGCPYSADINRSGRCVKFWIVLGGHGYTNAFYDFNVSDAEYLVNPGDSSCRAGVETNSITGPNFGEYDETEICSFEADTQRYRYKYIVEKASLIRIVDRCENGDTVVDSLAPNEAGEGSVAQRKAAVRKYEQGIGIVHDGRHVYLAHSEHEDGRSRGCGLKLYLVDDLDHPKLVKSVWYPNASAHVKGIKKYGNKVYVSYGPYGTWAFDVAGLSLYWRRGRYTAGPEIAFKHMITTGSFRANCDYSVSRIKTKVLHLPLINETDDISGFRNHGVIHNGPVWVEDDDWLHTCLSFDGRDDYISVKNPEVFGSMMTACLWMKADAKQNAALIAKVGGPKLEQHHWMLAIDREQRLRGVLRTAGSTLELFTGPQSIPIHSWVHVAMAYHDGQWTLYIDGEEAVTVSKSGMIGFNDRIPVTIGHSPLGRKMSAFSGRIREVHLYDYDLEPYEIADLAHKPKPVRNRKSAGKSTIYGEISEVRYFYLSGRRLQPGEVNSTKMSNGIIFRKVTTSTRQVYTEKLFGGQGRAR